MERELTKDELRWCRRLERALKAKPRSLEVYVALDSVTVLDKGAMDRCFVDSQTGSHFGDIDRVDEYGLFSIHTKITGDASGL